MKQLASLYSTLLDACGLLAGFVFVLLALFVSIDVVIRNVGLGNFGWLIEISEYALYGATFIAAPWVLRLGAHVRVDLVVGNVPRRAALALEIVTDLIGLAISLILFWYSLAATIASAESNSLIFKDLVVTEWWLLAVLPASMALLAIEFVVRLVRAVRGRTEAGNDTVLDGL
ncbi:TRAP transporter small permease [Oceanibacterium hippocampi]|uniref:TRAP transporter small permease protein n=1 Tax=Oceanibacterium hippocampi TaxID=745714 RepID=A0A1Y5TY99_9PROT|nr:TRAP transporter small permease [Oceanibacterium hippocampi]SLN76350.1 Tripartite ATP-independent periplasmic transporters, DctQ component [Oceanibacterium hippocampi]